MSIQYTNIQNLGIYFVNKINDISIYKYTINECDKYFKLSENINYFGYINDNTFYVVSLNDGEFDENFKSNFKFINESMLSTLTNNELKIKDKMPILKQLKEIKNFIYITFSNNCEKFINLDNSRKLVNELNQFLVCKKFVISINYAFQIKNESTVSAYIINSNSLILCIFHNDKNCVSSVVITYDDQIQELYFDSKTQKEYENNNFNKLLRAIIIIIAKNLYPNVKYVVSNAINPISAYLMIKYFNAETFDENEKKLNIKFNAFSEIKTYFDNGNYIISKVEINVQNIENAYNKFKEIVKKISCEDNNKLIEKGGRKCSLKSKIKRRNTIKKKRLKHPNINTKKIKFIMK